MKTNLNKMSKGIEIMDEDLFGDIAICAQLNDKAVEELRNGTMTEICVEINEENQYRLLENVDGRLVMNVGRKPRKDYSCFYYNHGVFPYEMKEALLFIGVNGEKDNIFTKIVGEKVEAIEVDFKANRCVWVVSFEVVPVLKDFKTFLMRWEADDDSFTDDDLEVFMRDMENGSFHMDWLISDWEEARRGDFFYMIRTGDDRAGIVMNGQIISDPYPVESLSGDFDHAMCVDVVCMNVVEPGGEPHISLKELQTAIPEFDWEKGQSGELLTGEVAKKLAALWSPDTDDWDDLDDYDPDDYPQLNQTYVN